MERKNGFVFYESWYDGAKELKPKHRGIYLEAIIKFGLYGEETELKGIEKALFSAIKPTIKFNKKQKDNGRKGGANQGNSNARKTTQIQPKNDPNSAIYLEDKDIDRDIYKDKDKDNDDDDDNNSQSPSSSFSIEEFLKTYLETTGSIYGEITLTERQITAIVNEWKQHEERRNKFIKQGLPMPEPFPKVFWKAVMQSRWLREKGCDYVLSTATSKTYNAPIIHAVTVGCYADNAKDTIPTSPKQDKQEDPQIKEIKDIWNQFIRTNPDKDSKLQKVIELREQYGRLPDEVLRYFGMVQVGEKWYWKE